MKTKSLKKRIVAGMLGNTLEWYDFILFGAFASTMTQVFFPEDDPQVGLLKTYGVFATGFIMRPLGAIFFGRIGDKFGRKSALLISILLMSIPTFLMGLLPSHQMIGLFAPLLLILLRLLQGFAMGGEYSGSMVFLFEHAPLNRKAFYSSWVDSGCLLGVLCGTLANWITSTFLSNESYLSWGWRLPFLISIVFSYFAFYYRKNFEETPSFLLQKENYPTQTLRSLSFKIPTAIFIYAFGNVGFYIFLIFLPNFLVEQKQLSLGETSLSVSLLSGLMAICIPFFGYCSDVFGNRKILTISIIITSLVSFPLFVSAATLSVYTFLTFQILFAICLSSFYGGEAAILSVIFPTHVRFTGVSLSLSCTNVLFGGCTPLIAEWITQLTNEVFYVSLALFLVGIGAIIALCFSSDLAITQEKLKQPSFAT